MAESLQLTLTQLHSADNAKRQLAEHELESKWLLHNPNGFCTDLLSLCLPLGSEKADFDLITFNLVLLRRVLARQHQGLSLSGSDESIADELLPPLWFRLREDVRSSVKSALLQMLQMYKDHRLARRICDVVSVVCHLDSEWMTVLRSVLVQAVSGARDLYSFVVVFWIIDAQPEIMLHSLGSSYVDFETVPDGGECCEIFELDQTVGGLFRNALSPASYSAFPVAETTVQQVILAALSASVNLITHNLTSKKSRQAAIVALLPGLVEALMYLKQYDDCFIDALEAFIILAEVVPKALKPALDQLVPFLSQLVGDRQLDAAVRKSGLEFLVTLAEAAPGICRKMEAFSQTVVPVCLRMMTEIDVDTGSSDEELLNEWNTSEDINDDEDADANNIAAEQAVDRLACALGGKYVLPPLFTNIPAMLASPEWRDRYAALMCISAIAEGCADVMKAEMNSILDMVMPRLLSDNHARVRYAACNAIGQLCTDFEPDMQLRFHAVIVPGLCQLMDMSAQQPRVACHGAAALVNFCEGCQGESDLIVPYLDMILQRLDKLLQLPLKYVQEQAITTLATLSNAAGTDFLKYFPSIMPAILSIFRSATLAADTQKDYRVLCGKAIECASLMALAVGKEAFAPFSEQLIHHMIEIQKSSKEPDDPQVSYLLSGWARLCKVLGQDFLPYLDMVMKPLLEAAAFKPDFTLLGPGEDETTRGFSEDDGWQFTEVDGQTIGIKTTALEEKCTAVEMLVCYARELQGGFVPYFDQVQELVKPLLKFYFHSGIRMAAAALLPQLLNSLKLSGRAGDGDKLRRMWQESASALLHVIYDESDPECLQQFLSDFAECLQVMGKDSLVGLKYKSIFATEDRDSETDRDILHEFAKNISGQVTETFHRISDRISDSGDVDREMEKELQAEADMDDAILGDISRCVHEIFKTHPNSFLPYIPHDLLPLINGMLMTPPDSPVASKAKQLSLCIFADIIEFCGPKACWEMKSIFWNALTMEVVNSNTVVRQAAVYGIGTLAYKLDEYKKSSTDTADVVKSMWSNWSPLLSDTYRTLEYSLSLPFVTDPGQQIANENAIGAMGKIIRYVLMPNAIASPPLAPEMDALIDRWLSIVTFEYDAEEAFYAFQLILDLIEANSAVFKRNILRIALLTAKVLVNQRLFNGVLDPEIESKAKELNGKLDQHLTQTIIPKLSLDDKRWVLAQLASPEEDTERRSRLMNISARFV